MVVYWRNRSLVSLNRLMSAPSPQPETRQLARAPEAANKQMNERPNSSHRKLRLDVCFWVSAAESGAVAVGSGIS